MFGVDHSPARYPSAKPRSPLAKRRIMHFQLMDRYLCLFSRSLAADQDTPSAGCLQQDFVAIDLAKHPLHEAI